MYTNSPSIYVYFTSLNRETHNCYQYPSVSYPRPFLLRFLPPLLLPSDDSDSFVHCHNTNTHHHPLLLIALCWLPSITLSSAGTNTCHPDTYHSTGTDTESHSDSHNCNETDGNGRRATKFLPVLGHHVHRARIIQSQHCFCQSILYSLDKFHVLQR